MIEENLVDPQAGKSLSRSLLSRRPRLHAFLRRTHLACSLIPWYTLVVSLMYAAYVRNTLGRWPAPMIEEIHLPWMPLLENLSSPTLLALPFGTLIWLLILIVRWARREREGFLLFALLLFSGFAAIFVALYFDTHHFVDWWLD